MSSRELGLGGHSSSFGQRGVRKRLEALARLTPLTGDRLLDLGCGNGLYTVELADGFGSVDAVDVEPERLAEFEDAIKGTSLDTKITITHGRAESLPFASATFDVVTTIEVLEHVSDLGQTLREVARVLKPGGRLLLTSPNRYFPFETHGVLVGRRRFPPQALPFLPWIPPLHARLSDARCFTVRSLAPTVESHGFRLIGTDYVMPPFDRSTVGSKLRPIFDRVERSPFKLFGMALVLAFERRTTSA